MSDVKTCRCGEPMIWMKTPAGRSMPVNYTGAEKSTDVYDHNVHVSHFATCRLAAEFRREKK
jgi:hypothetical protein